MSKAYVEILNLFVSGVPETKGSWKSIRTRNGPRLVADNDREAGWALAVAWSAKPILKATRFEYGALDRYRVSLFFVLPVPKGKKHRRDLDKLMRSVLDALTGLVWPDDERVDQAVLDKTTSANAREHGARIVVERIEQR